jgi:hypothetical protein
MKPPLENSTMKWTRSFHAVLIIGLLATRNAAPAAEVPFTEDFTANVSNWADNTGLNLLAHVASGGPDGGAYASTDMSLLGLGDQSAVLFRAQDEFNSSGHAFEGNWLAQNIGRFSALVRHDAPQPLNYFARFSLPANSPGGTAVKFVPVLPNTWTQLDFDIRAGNPEFVTFEGASFGAVFSNVGHVQIGVDIPAGLGSNPTAFTFDIDKASIALAVAEPSCLAASMVAGGMLFVRRRRISRRPQRNRLWS